MLTVTATPSATTLLVSRGAKTSFTLSDIRIKEDDDLLTNKLVAGTLSWGDGSLPINLSLAPVHGELIVPQLSNSFGAGFFNVVISAQNFRAPLPDRLQKVIQLNINSEAKAAVEAGQIFGPILPRESGYPNGQQWSFSTGKDLLIQESAVRMLLLTNKGERLLNPQYGISRDLIFQPDSPGVDVALREELINGLSVYVPSVELQEISILRVPNSRSVKVQVVLVSRFDEQPFQVDLQLER